MHELLASIRQRPGMYLGPDNDSFTALCGFLSGYQSGYWAGAKLQVATPADACLVPHDFHRFVTEHYGREYPYGGHGWQHFVREHTDSEQAAFRLFFELLAEYDRQRPSA